MRGLDLCLLARKALGEGNDVRVVDLRAGGGLFQRGCAEGQVEGFDLDLGDAAGALRPGQALKLLLRANNLKLGAGDLRPGQGDFSLDLA